MNNTQIDNKCIENTIRVEICIEISQFAWKGQKELNRFRTLIFKKNQLSIYVQCFTKAILHIDFYKITKCNSMQFRLILVLK